MLTNLLPGIRDLRTPLATGYLWLLALWLWVPSQFKHAVPTTGIPGDITRLAHYASRAGVGIAVSFAAYLVGVLSKSLNPPLVRLGTFSFYAPSLITRGAYGQPLFIAGVGFLDFWRRWFPVAASVDETEKEREELAFNEKTVLVSARLSTAGLYSLSDVTRRAADDGTINKDARSKYNSYLIREVPRLGNALVGKETELYSVYDRLISEYEFRIGIGAPLIALTITLAAQWSLLWLLILLPVLVLLSTGSQQRMAAGDLLADAVRLKRIDVALPRELPASTLPSADQSDHTD